MIRVIDENKNHDKIIARAEVEFKHIQESNDLPDSLKVELKHFFEEYKKVEKSW